MEGMMWVNEFGDEQADGEGGSAEFPFEVDPDSWVLVGYEGDGGEVRLPDAVTGIDADVFEESDITGIDLSRTRVRFIEQGAFYECHDLADIKLPDCLEAIGEMAFMGCDSLRSARIPVSVNEIEYRAFCDSAVEPVAFAELLCAKPNMVRHVIEAIDGDGPEGTPDGLMRLIGEDIHGLLDEVAIRMSDTPDEAREYSARLEEFYTGDRGFRLKPTDEMEEAARRISAKYAEYGSEAAELEVGDDRIKIGPMVFSAGIADGTMAMTANEGALALLIWCLFHDVDGAEDEAADACDDVLAFKRALDLYEKAFPEDSDRLGDEEERLMDLLYRG
jgi:hypothetical protein